MGKPVRMADIAEQLHISVVSVSKALAGKPGVSEEMRAKVVALARQMGYEGVRGADSTATGNVAVLVSDRFFSESTFYSSLYRALLLASGDERLTCMMEIVTRQAERDRTLPDLIAARKVDGVIFMGNLDEGYLNMVADAGLPTLLLDFHMAGNWNCVVGDNTDGGYTLTRHLLDLGRRELGFVGSIRATSSIMDRYLGYQRALRIAGVAPREEWLLEDRDENGEFIPLSLPDPLPQGFVCSCDEVAYNLVEALQKRGVRVPEDVAVCGYDDFRFATLSSPQLTTYRVDVELMGRTALGWLGQKLRGEQVPPMSCAIPGQLVVRGSSGAGSPA